MDEPRLPIEPDPVIEAYEKDVDRTFDYTKWQASLWPDVGVEELSREAMRVRRASELAK